MTLGPQITFRNMEPSARLEDAVLKEAAWLGRFFPRIMSCRVAIEGPKRGEKGLCRIRIDLGVPGEELLVEQTPTLHATLTVTETMHRTKKAEPHREHRESQLAIREAFHEVRRRVQDYVRRIGGQTKQHEPMPTGKVIRLSPDEGFGFLYSEGRAIYFHRNSVLGGNFNRLRVGSRVRFAEEMGEDGPQATTVRLIRVAAQRRTADSNAPISVRRRAVKI